MTSSDWNRTALSTSLSGTYGKVELAGDGPEAGNPDDDRRAGELAVLPQLPDGFGHGRTVADLAVDDGAERKPDLAVGEQHWLGVGHVKLSGAYGARTDIETNRQMCHLNAPFTSRRNHAGRDVTFVTVVSGPLANAINRQ